MPPVSVRFPPTTPAALVARISTSLTESRVSAVTARDVRSLGLEVVPDPLPDDLGHDLIVSAAASLADKAIRDRLTKLFQLLPAGA